MTTAKVSPVLIKFKGVMTIYCLNLNEITQLRCLCDSYNNQSIALVRL